MGDFRLPAALRDDDVSSGQEMVEQYLAPDLSRPGGVAFTGALFDVWDGGGSRAEVADRFTDADVNAVAMLSVEIPPRAVVELLGRRRNQLSALLVEIPLDVDLVAAHDGHIGPESPAWRLWEALRAIDDIEWVTASKLLARKRPRLLPVYDRVVREVVGRPTNFWRSLQEALSADGGWLQDRLRDVRDRAGATAMSPLRIFDVVCWMEGRQRGLGVRSNGEPNAGR